MWNSSFFFLFRQKKDILLVKMPRQITKGLFTYAAFAVGVIFSTGENIAIALGADQNNCSDTVWVKWFPSSSKWGLPQCILGYRQHFCRRELVNWPAKPQTSPKYLSAKEGFFAFWFVYLGTVWNQNKTNQLANKPKLWFLYAHRCESALKWP